MNPAERLLSIYEKLVSQHQDRSMLQTWAEVFGLEIDSENLEDEVTTCIIALRAQIDFARVRLTANEVPIELTSPGFERLKLVASPGQFNQSWNNMRGNIQPPECRQSFAWGTWVLRSEAENEMHSEEMTELLAGLKSLEESLGDTEMSPYLREFIQRQVNTIRAALRVYGVQGVRPLQEAMRKVVGDMKVEEVHLIQENEAAPEKAKGVLAKTAEIIDKTAKVCDSLDKIKKFGEGAYSLSCKAAPFFLPYYSKIAGAVGL
jgi:hypothetical protein